MITRANSEASEESLKALMTLSSAGVPRRLHSVGLVSATICDHGLKEDRGN